MIFLLIYYFVIIFHDIVKMKKDVNAKSYFWWVKSGFYVDFIMEMSPTAVKT